MPVYMEPTSVIKANLGLEPNGEVHAFFTSTCAKHMDKYLPARTLTLAKTVISEGTPTTNVKTDRIIYQTPYAHYVYEGISSKGRPLNYNTEKHELAGPHWDKRMVSAEMDEVVKEVQREIDRGRK